MYGNIFPDTLWERERAACFTSSEINVLFKDVTRPMTEDELKNRIKGDTRKTIIDLELLSDGAKTYIIEKVSEMLTGTVRQFTSPATDYGKTQEPNAVEVLRPLYPNIEYYGGENQMFFKYRKFAGGSPDAVNNNIVFEIKCPENPANHVKYLLLETMEDLKKEEPNYYTQLQMNMMCIAKDRGFDFKNMHGVFVSYCPLFEGDNQLKQLLIKPDLEFEANLDRVLDRAELYYLTIVKKLTEPKIKEKPKVDYTDKVKKARAYSKKISKAKA